jgi:hypothetical protein
MSDTRDSQCLGSTSTETQVVFLAVDAATGEVDTAGIARRLDGPAVGAAMEMITLWMVVGVLVAIVIAVVVDRRRGPSGPRDGAGSIARNRSEKGHDSFIWPGAG